MLTTLLMRTKLVMNADTNMVINTAIRMRLQDKVTKMSLNPTALKFTAPTVKVCTKASMPAIALDLAATITIIIRMTMRVSVDLRANRI